MVGAGLGPRHVLGSGHIKSMVAGLGVGDAEVGSVDISQNTVGLP